MAKFILGDIFIGNFPMTQGWGARPEVYKQFGQAGHNGWDFVMPNGTLVVSPSDGTCLGTFEERDSAGNLSGLGRYCKVLHEQNGSFFVSVYGHLQSIEISKGQKVKKFQLIAKSDNNGFSTAPHLHFGVYLSDAQGAKQETNGYGGYHDPGDTKVFEWKIENPAKPYEPSVEETMGITPDAKTAIDLLTAYQKANNIGNLEATVRSLVGSAGDLVNAKASIASLNTSLDEIKGELRDRDTFITGQKETVSTLQKQTLEIADILAVANDYPTIKGEIQKLIAVEDDNTVLRSQLAALKDSNGEEVGKITLAYEGKIKVLEADKKELKDKLDALKAEKPLDAFSDFEKVGIGFIAFFRLIKKIPTNFFKGLATRVAGVFKAIFGGGDKNK